MSQENRDLQLPFRQSHAFIIGINDYLHIHSLATAVNDAQGIAQRLEAQHGYTVHPPLLNADKKAILEWLTQTLPQKVGPEDRVVFYFAGHGIALDSETGPNGYLVPADARPGAPDTLIGMDQVHQALKSLPCRHGLLILDCCFAGAFKWSTGRRGLGLSLPEVIYEERFWRYVQDPAWQVITSSAYDQQAMDVLSNRPLGVRDSEPGRHSPFAEALFEALEGKGDVIPKGDGDGVITATELYMYLRDQVEGDTTAYAQRQTPALFTLERHDKGEFIFLHPRHRFNLPPAPDRNPFKGLSSFDEDDATLFYGRDRVIAALREKVAQSPLLVVSGASGTGKSSVIKAGLLPQLRREGWQVLPVLRPGKEPMLTLETELPEAEKELLGQEKTVLVIDQYEELITQCLDPAQAHAFEAQLADWLHTAENLRIILSVRADFEPQFEDSPLAGRWAAGRYVVPPFSLEELREVIVRPADQEVLFYEPPELVDQLVEEVSQAPGALPLLSFTLSELYEAYLQSGRQDRALLAADYQQLGGVIGALRTRAEEIYARQDEAHKNSLRRLMLRMASLEGGELAGKRVYEAEQQFSDPAETKRVGDVAKTLVAARLVQRGVDARDQVYVEPAHDALVRAWGRLWEWVKATGEEKLSLQNKLSQAVKDYEDLAKKEPKKARRLLWNDNPRLDLLNAELKEKNHGLNAREEAFVRASVQRRSSRRRRLVGSLLVATVIFAGLAFVANTQRLLANQKTKEERIQRLRGDSLNEITLSQLAEARSNDLANRSTLTRPVDPTVAFRLAEASLQYNPENTLGKGALLNAFYASLNTREAHSGFLYRRVEAMPGRLATTGQKRLWVERTESLPFEEFSPGWGAIVQQFYSPGKQYLFQLHQDQHGPFTALVWSFANQYRLEVNIGETESMFSPNSFSRNGEYIIIPVRNTAEVWRISNLRAPAFRLAAPFFLTRAFFDESNEHVYAEATNGQVYEWDLDGFPIGRAGTPNQELVSARIDPAGTRLVLDYSQGSAERWVKEGLRWRREDGGATIDLQEFRPLRLDNYSRYETTTDTSANGQYTWTIDNASKSLTVQPLNRDGPPLELLGHGTWIESVSLSPDGRFLLTTSGAELKLWDLRGNLLFSLDQGGVAGFLPDGKAIYRKDTPYMEYYEIGQIDIYPIAPELLIQWANEQEVYQLSPADKVKYGLEE